MCYALLNSHKKLYKHRLSAAWQCPQEYIPLKLQDMKLRERNQRHTHAGWKLRDTESAGKAEYGKPLMAQYWDFTHVIRYAFHLSRFQDSTRATSTSILDYNYAYCLGYMNFCVRLWHFIPMFSFSVMKTCLYFVLCVCLRENGGK